MAYWYESRWRTLGLVGAAMWMADFGVAFWLDRDSQVFLPSLWPALFVAAAVLVGCFARWPASTTLWKWAGMAGFVALGAQVARQVPNAVADGLDVRDWAEWAYITLWAGGAALWWLTWHYAVGEYHRFRRFSDEVS